MRHAEPSSKFRRDLRRVRGGIYGGLLSRGGEVDRVVRMLEAGASREPCRDFWDVRGGENDGSSDDEAEAELCVRP